MFFKKAVSWGYSCELKSLSGLLHEADAQLFRKMVNNKVNNITSALLIVFLPCLGVILTCTGVRLYCEAYLRMLTR